MGEDKNHTADPFAALRKRAESLQAERESIPQEMSAQEMREIVHELQTHQIELELQNEELRETQANLEQSRKRFADLYDFAPVGYLTLDARGLIAEANLTAAEMLGTDRRTLLNRPLSNYIVPADQDIFFRCRKALLKSDRAQTCELQMHGQQGQEYYVQLKAARSDQIDGNTDQYRVILTDISEQRRLAEALRRKSKVDALDVLSGGIAHNFNNHLAIILGFTELAQLKLPVDHEVTRMLSNIKTAAQRSRDLISKLMIFSRKDDFGQTSVPNIADVVNETIALLMPTIPPTINLQTNIQAPNVSVEAGTTQIQEALINLCTNALHALDEKGLLTITLDVKYLEAGDFPPAYANRPSGDYVMLSVADTGSGMSAETLEKIFDPFFTTKEVDKGTGIGLSTVQGMIESHNGFIKVTSSPDQGSCFELYLPASVQEPLEAVEQIAKPSSGRTASILFVDDEEMLGKLGQRMLSEFGYTVTSESSSRRALELFQHHPERFDLLITDQSMPDLNGLSLAQEIHKIRPKLPIILCTGYSTKMTAHLQEELGIFALCTKPLEYPRLLGLVQTALEQGIY